MMQAVFIGYDIPEALEVKWECIMPLLDRSFKTIKYDGDVIHIINDKSDIEFLKNLLAVFNYLLDINLTLDVFTVDNSLLKA